MRTVVAEHGKGSPPGFGTLRAVPIPRWPPPAPEGSHPVQGRDCAGKAGAKGWAGGRPPGPRGPRGSGVLLRLAGNTRTPVFMGRQARPPLPRDALGAAQRLALVSIKDKQMGRRTSGGPALGEGGCGRARGLAGGRPPPEKGTLPRGELGRQSWRETPSPPTKRREERGPRPHSCPLRSLPPRSALKGGGVLVDPKPPTGPLLPPSFVTAASARAPPGRPPSLRPQPPAPRCRPRAHPAAG